MLAQTTKAYFRVAICLGLQTSVKQYVRWKWVTPTCSKSKGFARELVLKQRQLGNGLLLIPKKKIKRFRWNDVYAADIKFPNCLRVHEDYVTQATLECSK